MKKKRLGEVLRERGHVSPTDLNKAIEDQQGKLIHLGELMLERGVVTKNDLAAALTEVTHVPYVDCENIEIDPEVLKLLPHAVAKRCCVLPITAQGNKLVAVMSEPQNLHIIDEQHVRGTIVPVKCGHAVGSQASHHFVHEALA